MTSFVDKLVPEHLWAIVSPLLSPSRPPPAADNRTSPPQLLVAIVFMGPHLPLVRGVEP
jgi:hypothetical protein